MDVLVLNGNVTLRVKSLTITPEKIWSKKTGRAADGSMKGDIVAIKMKLEAVLAPMTDAEAASFDAAISLPFFPAKFRNPRTGKVETHTVYASSPPYPVYSYVEGLPRYVGVGVSLIEQ